MKISTKIATATIALAAMLAASAPHAFAWSCQAEANDGTTGWSYNYPNRVARASAHWPNAMPAPMKAATSSIASVTADPVF